MAIIIDGKKTASDIKSELSNEVASLKKATGVTPGLAVIIVGNDPASQVYVRNKCRACETVGFYSEKYELSEIVDEQELISLIEKLNSDPKIHGILVQLPLPKHIDVEKVLLAIDPDKDVDAFHPYNTGKIMQGKYDLLPCTPAGVMELLKRYNIDIKGKNCTVIGRSDIVGKPMAMLLLHADGTVTVCHSKTKDLPSVCRGADIIVAAVGRADFVTADMIKDGAVVIDVGINRRADGSLCGDVKFDEVSEKASAITPVPGGVGPMTIAMLMKNTLTAAKKHYTNTL